MLSPTTLSEKVGQKVRMWYESGNCGAAFFFPQETAEKRGGGRWRTHFIYEEWNEKNGKNQKKKLWWNILFMRRKEFDWNKIWLIAEIGDKTKT